MRRKNNETKRNAAKEIIFVSLVSGRRSIFSIALKFEKNNGRGNYVQLVLILDTFYIKICITSTCIFDTLKRYLMPMLYMQVYVMTFLL